MLLILVATQPLDSPSTYNPFDTTFEPSSVRGSRPVVPYRPWWWMAPITIEIWPEFMLLKTRRAKSAHHISTSIRTVLLHSLLCGYTYLKTYYPLNKIRSTIAQDTTTCGKHEHYERTFQHNEQKYTDHVRWWNPRQTDFTRKQSCSNRNIVPLFL